MTVPPSCDLHDLGPQAQEMANHCKNEHLGMTLQCATIGSMIVMAGATAAHAIKDWFRNTQSHGRSK